LNRHALIAVALWILISASGFIVVFTYDPFPVAAAEQATLIDDAFTLLSLLAVPVFAMVVAFLLYSAFRFGRRVGDGKDGPPIRGNNKITIAWLAASTALTIAMIIHPGITGLNELRQHDGKPVDLVVQVEGSRFAWSLIYPEQKIKARKELVLPIDTVTRFKISSRDVIHSFWIPAFRIKIDAVPGIETTIVATPDKLGNYDENINFRVQCAELCGLGHAKMSIPVRVVEQEEFDEWIAQQSPVQ
jgi:cytochrome c oxidase subunit 2